jgi:hypothetical protein
MREPLRLHAPLHSGTDKVRIAIHVQMRHDGPGLARFELFEPTFQHAARRADKRADFRRELPSRTDLNALHGVGQRVAELSIVVHLVFEDEQGGRRALLSAVTERRMDHVLDRQIAVGQRGDDRRVLAASFGE